MTKCLFEPDYTQPVLTIPGNQHGLLSLKCSVHNAPLTAQPSTGEYLCVIGMYETLAEKIEDISNRLIDVERALLSQSTEMDHG